MKKFFCNICEKKIDSNLHEFSIESISIRSKKPYSIDLSVCAKLPEEYIDDIYDICRDCLISGLTKKILKVRVRGD